MRRFITVLIIILILVSLVLGGAWLIARRKSTQSGAAPLSFRQFLSGQTNPANPNNIPNNGTLTPIFVDDNTSRPQTPTTVTSGTQAAVFTNPNAATPAQVGTVNNQGTTSTPPRVTTTTSVDPNPLPPVLIPPVTSGNECTDTDLNIRFTPEELQKLQVLQNRFYAVSTTLHSDADVAIETGNHDNFKTKVNKITEMYNYCVYKSPSISYPNALSTRYKRRIPTPFWHEATQDQEVFLGAEGSFDGNINLSARRGGNLGIPVVSTGTTINGTVLTAENTIFGLRTLERSLRLNLW